MVLERIIRETLLEFISHQIIVCSWGITHIKVSTQEIRFSVNGLKYKGDVLIISDKQNKGVLLKLQNKDSFKCEPHNIIKTIDDIVESSDDYHNRLMDWFNETVK